MKKTAFTIVILMFSMGIFAQNGITKSEGMTVPKTSPLIEPFVSISLGPISTTTIEATFIPNSECDSFFVLAGTATNMAQFVTMMGQPIENLVQMWGIHCQGNYTHVWNQLDPNTEYTIYALPKNGAGENSILQTLICTTLQIGGIGLSTLTVEVSDIASTQARVIVTPNTETSVFHYGLITQSYFNEIGADSAINYFKTDPYPLYSIDNWIWPDLIPSTTYKVVGIGKNVNDEWGLPTIIEFTTLTETGIPLANKKLSLAQISPNPNNGKFNIKLNTLEASEIEIYDLTGSIVFKQSINNSNNSVNAEFLVNGIYTIKLLNDRKIIGMQKFIKSTQ